MSPNHLFCALGEFSKQGSEKPMHERKNTKKVVTTAAPVHPIEMLPIETNLLLPVNTLLK